MRIVSAAPLSIDPLYEARRQGILYDSNAQALPVALFVRGVAETIGWLLARRVG
jgi:hypothetical protein